MVTADMYWGSSSIPSGVPQALQVSYNPATGRGLAITGEVAGPGCSSTSCAERDATLTFLGSFYLGTDRMPDRGCRFTSSPQVQFFDSELFGSAADCAVWGGFYLDCSSASCGLRLRQTAYSGAYFIGQRTVAMQRLVDITVDDGFDWYTMPDALGIPSMTWQLDRSRPVQIDIEVRFTMKVEGDGSIRFKPHSSGPAGRAFVFDVPQWAIFATDA